MNPFIPIAIIGYLAAAGLGFAYWMALRDRDWWKWRALALGEATKDEEPMSVEDRARNAEGAAPVWAGKVRFGSCKPI